MTTPTPGYTLEDYEDLAQALNDLIADTAVDLLAIAAYLTNTPGSVENLLPRINQAIERMFPFDECEPEQLATLFRLAKMRAMGWAVRDLAPWIERAR